MHLGGMSLAVWGIEATVIMSSITFLCNFQQGFQWGGLHWGRDPWLFHLPRHVYSFNE